MHSVLATTKFLNGKVAVVTGAAWGIGRVIAEHLSAAGAKVVLADIDESGMAESQQRFDPSKTDSITVMTDVSNEADVENLMQSTLKKFGQLDILVNDAGIYPTTAVVDMPTEQWDRVIAVNLRGVFLCSRAAARIMVSQGTGGRIISMASGAGTQGRSGKSHYCASKAGVILFTKCLALELADHNILVNAISPGLVETEPKMKVLKEDTVEYERHQAKLRDLLFRRACPPEAAAMGALWLCSPDSAHTTGHVLCCDDGSGIGTPFRV